MAPREACGFFLSPRCRWFSSSACGSARFRSGSGERLHRPRRLLDDPAFAGCVHLAPRPLVSRQPPGLEAAHPRPAGGRPLRRAPAGERAPPPPGDVRRIRDALDVDEHAPDAPRGGREHRAVRERADAVHGRLHRQAAPRISAPGFLCPRCVRIPAGECLRRERPGGLRVPGGRLSDRGPLLGGGALGLLGVLLAAGPAALRGAGLDRGRARPAGRGHGAGRGGAGHPPPALGPVVGEHGSFSSPPTCSRRRQVRYESLALGLHCSPRWSCSAGGAPGESRCPGCSRSCRSSC